MSKVGPMHEQHPGMLIGGAFEVPTETERLVSYDAATGQPRCVVQGGGAADALRALKEAEHGLEVWADVTPVERARTLRAIAAALREATNSDIPELVATESGKRYQEAAGELAFSASYFDEYARLAEDVAEEWYSGGGHTHLVRRGPAGIAAAVTPWNFPVSIPARKIAPALAAGCSVLWKPSEVTPRSSMRIAELIDEHLPNGVLGVVLGHGRPIVEAWTQHPKVRVLSFTGSTPVGQSVAVQAAHTFTRTVMELGGQAPFIILDDADLGAAIHALDVAKFRNNGQSCIAANRVWAPRERFKEVVDAFASIVRDKRLGHPLDESTQLGPLAVSGDPARLQSLVEDAEAHGAKIVRGDAPVSQGFYCAPALCVDPSSDARILNEEVFGPAVAISPYDDPAEAIEVTARSPHGLAAYVCTQHRDRALELLADLDVGVAGVNTGTPNNVRAPFGGRGASGWGYEGGHAGLEEFLAPQLIAVREDSA